MLRRAPHTGLRSRFGCSPTTHRSTSASSCCSRAPERWPTADTSLKPIPRCSKTIELVPEEAVALRVRLTTACAGVEHLLGLHEDAYGAWLRALEDLEDANSAEAAALMIELALDGVYRMEFEQIEPWAQRALELARPLGDRR